MRIEAIFSRQDIEGVFLQFLPLEIDLDEGKGERILAVDEVFEISMLTGVGVRVGCKARVHWPILGISVPIALRSLHMVLVPSIELRHNRDCLIIRIRIEEADVAWVPSAIDAGLKDRVNRELAEKHIELVWGFGKTLSTKFQLPASLRSAEALALDVTQGRVGVSDEALGMSVAFSAKVLARAKES